MSSTLRVTNVSDTTGGTSTNLMSGLAKAWSNLNGTGTIAERDSFNISGYVDNGTGNYTFTISNDMSDANYQQSSTAQESGTGSNRDVGNIPSVAAGSLQVATSYVSTTGGIAAADDCLYVCTNIHGDLA